MPFHAFLSIMAHSPKCCSFTKSDLMCVLWFVLDLCRAVTNRKVWTIIIIEQGHSD